MFTTSLQAAVGAVCVHDRNNPILSCIWTRCQNGTATLVVNSRERMVIHFSSLPLIQQRNWSLCPMKPQHVCSLCVWFMGSCWVQINHQALVTGTADVCMPLAPTGNSVYARCEECDRWRRVGPDCCWTCFPRSAALRLLSSGSILSVCNMDQDAQSGLCAVLMSRHRPTLHWLCGRSILHKQ